MPDGNVTEAASQAQSAEQGQLSILIGRERESSSCSCGLEIQSDFFLGLALLFHSLIFVSMSMICLTFLGLCPDNTVQAGGIPEGNSVCLCVYSRKSLTLDKQGQCFDFRVRLILSLCHSASYLVGLRILSLAYRTCRFARKSGSVYI